MKIDTLGCFEKYEMRLTAGAGKRALAEIITVFDVL
jgi:hypothetical protein